MSDRTEYVYLIGGPEIPLVKIGRSTDVMGRLAAIQRMSPVKLTVLWQTEGGADLETSLHRWFRGWRSHGEWFEFPNGDAPERVKSAIPEIAREAQDAQRMLEERRARRRAERTARKVRKVWTAPTHPNAQERRVGRKVTGHSVGDVVRIVSERWRYSRTGVIRSVSLGSEYQFALEENDGRRHLYLGMFTEAQIVPQEAVDERPRVAPCRGVGCMCGSVV